MENGKNAADSRVRFVRIPTYGKALAQIEAETVMAVSAGSRVLVSTSEGKDDEGDESDSRSAAIAQWADGLSREYGLDWRRVGRDVLFTVAALSKAPGRLLRGSLDSQG